MQWMPRTNSVEKAFLLILVTTLRATVILKICDYARNWVFVAFEVKFLHCGYTTFEFINSLKATLGKASKKTAWFVENHEFLLHTAYSPKVLRL